MKKSTVKSHTRTAKGKGNSTVKSHSRRKPPKGWRKAVKSNSGLDPTNLSKAKMNVLKKKGVNLDKLKYSGF